MKYDYICSKCNGLVAKPNTAYGYSGHFCFCPNPTPLETIGLGQAEEQERQMNLRLKDREDLMNYLSECRKITVENNRGLWIGLEDLKKFLEG